MSVSFVIAQPPIFRTFTKEQSKAIHNIEIDSNFVEIVFHSNTEKAYVFKGNKYIIAHLSEMIKSPDLLGFSLGSTIAEARKVGSLEKLEFPED
jgi:hypothetical protein